MQLLLHTFFNYTVFGTLIIFMLSQLFIKLGRWQEPRLKMVFLQMILYLPVVFFALWQFLLPSWGAWHVDNTYLQLLVGLNCLVGLWGARLLAPFFPLFLAMIVLRPLLAHLVVYRKVSRFGWADEAHYRTLFTLLPQLCVKIGIASPRVIVSRGRLEAYTCSCWKPVLVISEELYRDLTAEELEAMLAHELAHLKRRDPLSAWLGQTMRDLMFFTPVAHLAWRFFLLELEKAADDLAVQVTGKRLVYGATLIKVWRMSQPASALVPSSPGLAFIPRTGILASRVERLLEERVVAKGSLKVVPWYILVLLVAGSLLLVTC